MDLFNYFFNNGEYIRPTEILEFYIKDLIYIHKTINKEIIYCLLEKYPDKFNYIRCFKDNHDRDIFIDEYVNLLKDEQKQTFFKKGTILVSDYENILKKISPMLNGNYLFADPKDTEFQKIYLGNSKNNDTIIIEIQSGKI